MYMTAVRHMLGFDTYLVLKLLHLRSRWTTLLDTILYILLVAKHTLICLVLSDIVYSHKINYFASTMAQASSSSTLMGLPVELRLAILDYLIPRDANNMKTITMSLIVGLRHGDPDNIHIHDVYPPPLSLRRYLKGVGMVNHQVRKDAMVLLYNRTFIIRISINSMHLRHQCIADHAANHAVPMQWRLLLPGLDVGRVKELRIQAMPNENLVTWESIQWRLDSFCRILGKTVRDQGLLKLVVDFTDMQKSTPLLPLRTINPWIPVVVLDPPKATVEDVVRLLHPIWLYLRNVKACEVNVPEWASKDQWVLDAIQETKAAIRRSPQERNERNEPSENDQTQDPTCQCDNFQCENVHCGANEQGGPESAVADPATDDPQYNNDKRKLEQAETEENNTDLSAPTDNDPVSTESDNRLLSNLNDEEESEDTWAKIEGEEWDDFYLLPPRPPHVSEYQLRDSAWIFGEEPQLDSSEMD